MHMNVRTLQICIVELLFFLEVNCKLNYKLLKRISLNVFKANVRQNKFNYIFNLNNN